MKSILTWGFSGAGIGATVGGGVVGFFTGMIGAPFGTIIGFITGFFCGAALALIFEGTPSVLTQGRAREFLIKMQEKHPDLDIRTIVDATEHPPVKKDCHVYMFKSDGVIKCTKKDVMSWLKSACWKKNP